MRRKSSARLAAVQCAYRLFVGDEKITPTALFDDYMAQWNDDKASPNRAMSFDVEPDRALFMRLITGVMENRQELETLIKTSLGDKWKMERMSPLLLAILACAIFEMKYTGKTNPVIVVNEYVNLTGRFFEPGEIGFVNGLLDALSQEFR